MAREQFRAVHEDEMLTEMGFAKRPTNGNRHTGPGPIAEKPKRHSQKPPQVENPALKKHLPNSGKSRRTAT